MVKDTGGPAFPVFAREQVYRAEEDRTGTFQFVPQQGMTLRDYFATQALGPITAYFDRFADQQDELPAEPIARLSYAIADAMLAERAK